MQNASAPPESPTNYSMRLRSLPSSGPQRAQSHAPRDDGAHACLSLADAFTPPETECAEAQKFRPLGGQDPTIFLSPGARR